MLKILIIKLGYSETLDPEIGCTASLGDVVRTTPILHVIKDQHPDSHVTWLTDHKAEPLLAGIEQIDRVLVWDAFVPFQIAYEHFDILVNLEKVPGICAVADQVNAWQKFGFRFMRYEGTYMFYAGAEEAYSMCTDPLAKRENGKPWQQVLVELLGGVWKGQPYLLGYRPRSTTGVDVGFNYLVGDKWPNKAWPMEHWRELEKLLAARAITVSWQQGKNDLHQYIDWLHSCRVIVTNDSLGLHLAQPLNRKLVGLFGPTSEKEVFMYGDGVCLTGGAGCQCRPCFAARCRRGKPCLAEITPETVARTVTRLLAAPDSDAAMAVAAASALDDLLPEPL